MALPKTITAVFGGGLVMVSTFAPDVVPLGLRYALFVIGLLLMAGAAIAGLWHVARQARPFWRAAPEWVWIREAVTFATTGNWRGIEANEMPPADYITKGSDFLQRLRQAASDGRAVVRGRPQVNATEIDVPREHWREWHVSILDALTHEDGADLETEKATHRADGAPYRGLRVRRRDVQRLIAGRL